MESTSTVAQNNTLDANEEQTSAYWLQFWEVTSPTVEASSVETNEGLNAQHMVQYHRFFLLNKVNDHPWDFMSLV